VPEPHIAVVRRFHSRINSLAKCITALWDSASKCEKLEEDGSGNLRGAEGGKNIGEKSSPAPFLAVLSKEHGKNYMHSDMPNAT
jgi:hypothetical protein